ncbi:MAG: hypothetical protein PHP70_03715 [Gallionella sp.]|nr:hypothetical protein [Gallionella sp.]
MSHNLTQPDEIERVWRSMPGQDMDIKTPDGSQFGRTVKNTERDEFVVAAEFSCGVAHQKFTQPDR